MASRLGVQDVPPNLLGIYTKNSSAIAEERWGFISYIGCSPSFCGFSRKWALREPVMAAYFNEGDWGSVRVLPLNNQ